MAYSFCILIFLYFLQGTHNEEFHNELPSSGAILGELCTGCFSSAPQTFKIPSTVLYGGHVFDEDAVQYSLVRKRRKRDVGSDTGGIQAEGSLKIIHGLDWQNEYNYTNTTEYRNLENQMMNLLDYIFGSSEISHLYQDVSIQSVRKGSIIIDFKVKVKDTPSDNSTSNETLPQIQDTEQINEAFLAALQNVSSNFTIDMNGTSFIEVVMNEEVTTTIDYSTTTQTWQSLVSTLLQPTTSTQYLTDTATSSKQELSDIYSTYISETMDYATVTSSMLDMEYTSTLQSSTTSSIFKEAFVTSSIDTIQSTSTIYEDQSTSVYQSMETTSTLEPAETSILESAETTSILEPAETTSILEPAETTSILEPAETRSLLEPVETTTILEPPKTTSILEPAETTSILEPAETTSILERAETSSILEPAETTSILEPAETTSILEPAETTSILEPAETTSILEPAETTSLLEPIETTSILEPPKTTSILEPAETTSILEPAETTSILERAETSSILEPAETTSILEPAETTSILEPAETTYILEPAETTSLLEPIETTSILEPTETTSILEPAQTTSILEPTETTSILQPAETTSIQEPAETASILEPTETTTILEPAETTSIIEPTETTSMLQPSETTSILEPAETTSILELAETTYIIEPAETTSILEPAETTSILETAETTSILEPAQTTSILEPAETTSILEPAETTSILEPAETTSILEPAETTSILEPAETTSILELTETSSILEPAETTSILEPAETTSILEPAVTTSILEPAETTSILEPAETTSILEPAETTSLLEPVETTSILEPTETTSILEPAETTSILEPAETTSILEPTETTSILEPTESTYILESAETTYILEPAETTSILEPAETTSILESAETTYILKPTETTSILEPAETTSILEPAETTSILEPTETTSILEPAETTSLLEPVETTTILEPAETTSILEPAETTSILEPTETTSILEPAETTPILEPAETTSILEPTETTSILEPAETTSILEPAETTSLLEPVETTSILEPAETTSIQETAQTTSILEPTETTTILEPAETTSILEPTETTSMLQPLETTSILEPAETTSMLELAETTSIMEPAETTSILEPAKTTSILEPAETTSILEPAETTSILEPAKTTSILEPAETTSILEPAKTTSILEPAEATSILELTETTSILEPTGTTSILEPAETTSIVESAETTSILEPAETTSILEPAETTSVLEPAETTSILEPAETTSILEPAETASILEPAETTSILEPAETTSLLEPAQTTSILEPTETTILEPAETTSILEPTETTSMLQPSETTSIMEPAETTSMLELAETTSIMEPAETTSILEPAETTSILEPAETTSILEQAETTSILEPAETTSILEPAETTTILQPAETTSIFEPAETTSILEPVETTSILEPTETTSILEPTETTSILEPAETTSILEPTETTSILEPTETTSILEPAETTSILESAETTSILEPSETTSILEPAETTSILEPAETTSILEQIETTSILDPGEATPTLSSVYEDSSQQSSSTVVYRTSETFSATSIEGSFASTSTYVTSSLSPEQLSSAIIDLTSVQTDSTATYITDTSPSTVPTTLAPSTTVKPSGTYSGTVKVQSEWDPDLEDKSSPKFKQMEQEFQSFLSAVLAQTGLTIEDIEITGFRQGSIIVDFNVVIADNNEPIDNLATQFNAGYDDLASPEFLLEESYTEFGEAQNAIFSQLSEQLMSQISTMSLQDSSMIGTADTIQETSIVEPAETTSVLELAETTSLLQPSETTSILEPAETTFIQEQAQTTSIHEPAATTSILEPAETTSILKPAETTSILEPAATTSIMKPAETTSILEPAETTSILEPAETTSILQPAETTSILESAETTSILKPAETTSILEPVETTSILEPTETTYIMEPAHTTSILEHTETTSILEPAETTSIMEPAHTTSILEHAETTSILEHAETTNILKPAETTSILKPAETTSIQEQAQTTSIMEPAETTSILEPAETTSILTPAETTSILEPAETTSILEPAERTSTLGPAETTSILEPAEITSIMEPAETTSILGPAETTSIMEPAEITSILEPTETTSILEPTETTTIMEPTETPSILEPSQATSILESTETTSILEPAETTSILKPAETTSILEPAETTYILEPAETTSILEPAETTSILEPSQTTSILEPAETTSILEPAETTSILEPAQTTFIQTTSIQELTETTSILEPSGTTSVLEQAETTSILEPAETTSILEPAETTSILESAETTSVLEPAETTSILEPAETTSILEPAETTSILQPAETTSLLRPAETTSILEPAETTSILEPTETTSILESTETTSILQSTKTTSILESTGTTSILEPAETTSILEPAETTSILDPTETTSILEPAETAFISESTSLSYKSVSTEDVLLESSQYPEATSVVSSVTTSSYASSMVASTAMSEMQLSSAVIQLTSVVTSSTTTTSTLPPTTTITTTTKATTLEPVSPTTVRPAGTYSGTVKVQSDWNPSLSNPESQEYKDMEAQFLTFLMKVLANTGLTIDDIEITGFRQGSIIVEFNVNFVDLQIPIEDVKVEFNNGYSELTAPEFVIFQTYTEFGEPYEESSTLLLPQETTSPQQPPSQSEEPEENQIGVSTSVHKISSSSIHEVESISPEAFTDISSQYMSTSSISEVHSSVREGATSAVEITSSIAVEPAVVESVAHQTSTVTNDYSSTIADMTSLKEAIMSTLSLLSSEMESSGILSTSSYFVEENAVTSVSVEDNAITTQSSSLENTVSDASTSAMVESSQLSSIVPDSISGISSSSLKVMSTVSSGLFASSSNALSSSPTFQQEVSTALSSGLETSSSENSLRSSDMISEELSTVQSSGSETSVLDSSPRPSDVLSAESSVLYDLSTAYSSDLGTSVLRSMPVSSMLSSYISVVQEELSPSSGLVTSALENLSSMPNSLSSDSMVVEATVSSSTVDSLVIESMGSAAVGSSSVIHAVTTVQDGSLSSISDGSSNVVSAITTVQEDSMSGLSDSSSYVMSTVTTILEESMGSLAPSSPIVVLTDTAHHEELTALQSSRLETVVQEISDSATINPSDVMSTETSIQEEISTALLSQSETQVIQSHDSSDSVVDSHTQLFTEESTTISPSPVSPVVATSIMDTQEASSSQREISPTGVLPVSDTDEADCGTDCSSKSIESSLWSSTSVPDVSSSMQVSSSVEMSSTLAMEIDECYNDPCPVHSTCNSTGGSYFCMCNEGFRANFSSCDDIDECTSSPCGSNSHCKNTYGSYQCVCDLGYTDINGICSDIDECLQEPCPIHSQCVNTDGSYQCNCDAGFVKEGNICKDIDECTTDPCSEYSECSNSAGSFFCSCNFGFREVNQTCIDIDECLEDKCPAHSICENSIGSYYCNCTDGYQKNNGLCEDVNECKGDPCQQRSTCLNTQGSFVCTCDIGFQDQGGVCVDVDECLDSPCISHAVCFNTIGSYNCPCDNGYKAHGGVCIDIDECQENPCPGNSHCINSDGSYICPCDTGFADINGICTDIDECINAEINCPNNTDCINTVGSYSCPCQAGYSQKISGCEDNDECLDDPCSQNSICQNLPGSFQCNCYNGFYKASPTVCQESLVYNSSLKVLEMNGEALVYTTVYESMASTESQEFITNVDTAITTWLESDVGSDFLGYEVYGISSGSLVADGYLYMNGGYIGDATSLTGSLISGLNYYNTTGLVFEPTAMFVEDIDECSSPDWNDCSEDSTCTNTIGSYNCSCNTGFIDHSPNPSRPGRICLIIDDNNKDPIDGLSIFTHEIYYKVGEAVKFRISLKRGSHVEYIVNFGDGSSLAIYQDPEMLSFLAPYTIEHTYQNAGEYAISFTAQNTENSKSQSINLIIEDQIRSLKVRHELLQEDGPENNVTISLSIEETGFSLSNLVCLYDFGDSTKSTVSIVSISDVEPNMFSHGYELGQYSVVVNCSNHISYMDVSESIVVQERIQDLSISTSKTYMRPEDRMNVNIQTLKGSHVIYTLDLGDGRNFTYTMNNNKKGLTNIDIPVQYFETGNFTVTVGANNLISYEKITLDYPIIILYDVRDLTIAADTPIAIPPGNINITIGYTGAAKPPNYVTCATFIGGNFVSDTYTDAIDTDKLLNIKPVWNKKSDLGRIDIVVNCSNILGFQELSTEIVLQAIIEGASIAADSQHIALGTTIYFLFGVEFGSHISYSYDFGDGKNRSGSFFNMITENEALVVRHAYNTPGIYDVRFEVSNHVSKSTASLQMFILEDIFGLTVTPTYKNTDNSDSFRLGHGDLQMYYPLERKTRFKTGLDSGNEVSYVFDFGDGTIFTSKDDVADHHYLEPGRYKVTINASNALFYDYIQMDIVLQQTVLINTLTNNGPTETYKDLSFTLNLGRAGTDPCYVWDMGDNSLPIVYGGDNCKERSDLGQFRHIPWTPEKQLIHKSSYKANETFTVTVQGLNVVSEGTIQDFAVITGVGCSYPKVHIIGGGQQIDKPVERKRSDWISLESNVDISCEVTDEAEYKWIIERLEQGVSFLDFILTDYTPEIDHVGLFKLMFPQRAFSVGDYKISLNVSMKGIPGLFSVHFTYLRIHQTQIVAKIYGGSARAIGYDKQFSLDGLTETYDPDATDQNNKSNLTFTWSCRKNNETFPSIMEYIELPDPESNETLSGGGCFGTGIGLLNTTNPVLQLNSRLLELHSENHFHVDVTDDERLSAFEQTVIVVEGDPREFVLTCLVNCKSKMNPSGEFSIVSQCKSCRPLDKIDYVWSLFILNSTTNKWIPVDNLDELIDTELYSAGISFKPKVLIGGELYKLRLNAKVFGYARSLTEHEFVTNLPPYGGTCFIDPEVGYALKTKFVIQCKGWLNPGEENAAGDGLLYRFWSTSHGGDTSQLLYYGTDTYTPESQLPLGDIDENYMFDLSVRIANPIGEYVETKLVVQVLVPPITRQASTYKNLTNGESSKLGNLFSSGREQEAKQLIVAVASLLNDPSAKLAGTTINTEATTVEYSGTDSGTKPQPADTQTTPKEPSTYPDTTEPYKTTEISDEDKEKIEEERKQRVELRADLVKTLSNTEALTLDSLQQTALAYKVITQETSELSDECQEITLSAMDNMASTFESIVNEDRGHSVEQELMAAEDIIASLGNVILSVTNVASGITEGDYTDRSNTLVSTTLNPDKITDAPLNLSPDDSAKEVKAKEIARQITRKALDLADEVVKTVLQKRTPGAPPLVLKNQMFTIVADRREASNLNNTVLSSDEGSFKLPSVDHILDNSSSSFIDTKLTISKLNPFIWDSSSSTINTPILTMNLYDVDGYEIPVNNLSSPIIIDVDVSHIKTEATQIYPVLPKDETMYYHVLQLNETKAKALQVVVKPVNPNVTLELYIKKNDYPSETDTDYMYVLPMDVEYNSELDEEEMENMRYTVLIPREEPGENDTGITYLGVKEFNNESEVDDYSDYYDYNGEEEEETIMANYTFKIVTSDCRFWDEDRESWSTEGCEVSPVSNSKFTRCLCNHLTSFASGVFVPPNQINFDTVFDDLGAKLLDNNAVLITISCMIFIYLVASVWARRKDKQDVEKWGVAPLADNVIGDRYFYQISVHTGMRGSAGTRSRVSFVLSGDGGDTGVRQLIDEKGKKVFNRSSVNQYIMGVQKGLGPLSYLRIWHDNSGKKKHQGWYLSKVIVTDLQTNQIYFFLCNRWLAVEEDDGMIDRILPVAGNSDVTNFNHLFFSQTKKNFTDSHLWVSVFSRPQKSYFTRVQRVGCILSLVFTTMMADAMFYKVSDDMENTMSFTLGPLIFSVHEIYISFVCSLVVLPVNILIDQLFRRSKPRSYNKITNDFINSKNKNLPKTVPPLFTDKQKSKEGEITQDNELADVDEIMKGVDLRPSTSAGQNPSWEYREEDLNKKNEEVNYPRCDTRTDSRSSTRAESRFFSRSETRCETRSESRSDSRQGNEKKEKKSKKKSTKKITLPYWCAYIGWFLVFATTGVSAFITFSYSMEWGKTKSIGWLSSMLLSLGESVALIQPMKILIIAVIVAWLIKKPELEDVIEDKDLLKPLSDEEITEKAPTAVTRPRLPAPMLNQEDLMVARERRLKEIRMFSVIREIIFYVIFLILLVMVSVHNRDFRSFNAREAVLWQISPKISTGGIRSISNFWDWTRKELVPNIYISKMFNGDPVVDAGDQRMVADMASYRVGPVRIRQHRVIVEKCKLPRLLWNSGILCNGDWDWDTQDNEPYSEGWKPLPVNTSISDVMNYPWKYRTDAETNGAPHAGKIGVYPSGGYIVDLIGSRRRVDTMIEELIQLKWLDHRTRALFVEFTLYNPNVNLFTQTTVAFETPATGSLVSEIVVKTFRLFSYLGGYGVVVALCDALTLLFILYFSTRMLKKLKKERRAFFTTFWNGVEFLNFALSITCVVMYTGRHLLTSRASNTVKKLRDAFYNFQRMALWDELFSILLAFVIFLSTIKLIHMFRFNRKMSMLGWTIMTAAKELSAFSFCFAIWVTAFMSFSYIVFGPYLEGYSSVLTTLETLLSFALGKYAYEDLSNVNRIFGPLFFFAFILFIVFILLNMFVTIMNDSFTVVRSNLEELSNDYELVDFIKIRFKTWLFVDVARFFKNVTKKYKTGYTGSASEDSPQHALNRFDLINRKLDDVNDGINSMSPWNTGVNYNRPAGLKFVNGYSEADDELVNFYFPDFNRLLPLFSEDPGIKMTGKEAGKKMGKEALRMNPKADVFKRAKGALKIDN